MKFKVDCPSCDGTGHIITGWDADAFENIESDCPDCDCSGEIEVVPVAAVEKAISTLAPRRAKLVETAKSYSKTGDVEGYGYGLVVGQRLALGSALHQLLKLLDTD